MTQAIVVRKPQAGGLTMFGRRKEVIELAKRVQATIKVNLPGGGSRTLSGEEAARLAGTCILNQLEPGVDVTPIIANNSLALHYSASAWLKGARKVIKQGNVWPEFDLISDPSERGRLGIPAGAIAYRARVYDTPSIRAYTDLVQALAKSGAPWDEIKLAAGPEKPHVDGIAWYLPSDKTAKSDAVFSPHERAKNRALKQALKKAYNLPGLPDDAEDTGDYTGDGADEMGFVPEPVVVDGEAGKPLSEMTQAELDALTLQQDALKEKRAKDKRALFGEE